VVQVDNKKKKEKIIYIIQLNWVQIPLDFDEVVPNKDGFAPCCTSQGQIAKINAMFFFFSKFSFFFFLAYSYHVVEVFILYKKINSKYLRTLCVDEP